MKAPTLSDPPTLSGFACKTGRPLSDLGEAGERSVIGLPRPKQPDRVIGLRHEKRNQILVLSDTKILDSLCAYCRLHVKQRNETPITGSDKMDMLDVVYGTVAVMVAMVALMVKVSLNTCKYRR